MMSSRPESKRRVKNKSLSLSLALFILILFASSTGEEGGGRSAGAEGTSWRPAKARGCWEMAEDAKQAPPPTLEAHIFVLRNLVCCQRPHFGSMA